LTVGVCSYELDDDDVADVIAAFEKVFSNLPALSNRAAEGQV